MNKLLNGFFVCAGFLSLGLGILGIVLPILPTTPFLLLAAACFARGSERFHRWFTKTGLYKKYIEQPMKKKEMTAGQKFRLLASMSALMLIGFIFSPIWHAKVLLVFIAAGHYYYILCKVKTEKEIQDEPGDSNPIACEAKLGGEADGC